MEEMEGLNVTECTRCSDLVASRSQIVNGVGPADAELLFVGEAPGGSEDEQGEPFVGRSGDVLTDTLREQGLTRDDVRITNCVRCRPPENRDPRKGELANCRGYLETEIDLVDPSVIVTLGKVPSEHLLDRSVGVTNEAGEVVDTTIDGTPHRVMICVHPAATLYDRSQKSTFENTIEKAAGFIDDDGGQTQLGDF